MKPLTCLSIFFVCLLFASCQKVDFGEETEVPEGKVLAKFQVGIYDMIPFDRVNAAKTRSEDIASLCRQGLKGCRRQGFQYTLCRACSGCVSCRNPRTQSGQEPYDDGCKEDNV